MDPHPTITIDHYSSSSTTSTSTSLHSKFERNEGAHYNRTPQHQQHSSHSSKSSTAQSLGGGSSSSSHDTTGVISKHHHNEHSSPSKGKGKQSKSKVPVRQRSVSPPTTSTNNSLFAIDPRTARRNRRKSVCAVLIAPPSPTRDEKDIEEESSDTISTNIEGAFHKSNNMPDSSNHRRSTMDYGAPVNHSGKHHTGHRKHSTPKHSPNASPRGSKSNLAAFGSSLMDTINKANLCIRRKSSPAINEQLTTVEISSLRGSLALADALSSTSNNPQDLSPSGKQRRSSKQSGYSSGSPVYVETSSGMVELRRKDHSNKGYINDDSRRLSSPSSLEKGKI